MCSDYFVLQAIFTLSQFSAILTPRQNAYLNKKCAQNKDQSENILCPDSFLETLKNCDFSFVRYLSSKKLFENSLLGNLRLSYVSTDTFFENKYGFSEKNLHKDPVPTVIFQNNRKLQVPQGFYQKLAYSLKHQQKFTFDVQVRTFKTDRSVKAEKLRNPTLSARVKNALGLSTPETIEVKSAPELPVSNERLKTMLASDDVNITEAERQRMKIAFAEGYLLGNNPKAGKAAKYFKIVQQVLTIAIFLAIVISLMASAGSSVFRYVKNKM